MHCPSCNAECKIGTKFCPECGTALTKSAQTSDPAVSAPSTGERRQLTVMFCDVVNSTGLSEQLDPEELLELMRHYHDICGKVIQRFDGRIAKYLGDGLLINFGYPNAHEDDAQRAVRAGLGMLEGVKFSHFQTSSGRTVPIDIRIGVHTGLVLIDEIGFEGQRITDIIGETPNIAARLQGVARPNSMVISGATEKLVSGFFETELLPPEPLKGVTSAIDIYNVLHESAARTRFEASRVTGITELIGRGEEFQTIKEQWKDAEAGHGHVIFVSGEAGIGKSRLTLAMKEVAAHEANAWLVEIQCSPYYQNTAFYPVASLLERTILKFQPTDDPGTRLAKLEGYLVQNGLDLEENVPLMQPLLSLPSDPRYRPLDPLSSKTKQRTFDLLLNLLFQRASEQPVLFIAEDLHWADPSTLELMALTVERIPNSRVLALLTYRPEFSAPWVIPQQTIALGRLPRNEARKMIELVVRQKQLPPEIADQILEKTDGVPLFVEELTRTILESGSLVEKEDHYDVAHEIGTVSVPSSLKDSLMSRLDRMAAGKRVAQVASVLGREFNYALLESIFPLDKNLLPAALNSLVDAGLVFHSGQSSDFYTFKHALVQDTAYDSLLKTERQKFHLATATALHDRFPDLYSGQPELVAYHYTAASQIESAIPEWLRAGKQADSRSANQEASLHYRKGMELLTRLPGDSPIRGYELPLQLSYGMSTLMVRGYSVPEVAQAITRARELIRYAADAPELPMILWALWAYYVTIGDLNISVKFAEEFLEAARRIGDDSMLVEANSMFVLEYFLSGKFIEAKKEMEACIARYSPERHGHLGYQFTQDPFIVSTVLGSWNEYMLGNPDRARSLVQGVLDYGKKLGHAFSLNFGVAFSAWLYYWMDMPDETEKLANEAMQIAQTNGYALWMGDALILLGWVQYKRGNFEQAFPLYEQGLGIFNAIGRGTGRPGLLDIRSEILIALGNYDEARATLDSRWEIEQRINQPFQRSIGLRIEAELVLAQSSDSGAIKRAIEFLDRSIEDARNRHARTMELKSMLRLLELCLGTAREQEILYGIQTLYSTFTEGFDVPLLQQAAAVLESSLAVSK